MQRAKAIEGDRNEGPSFDRSRRFTRILPAVGRASVREPTGEP